MTDREIYINNFLAKHISKEDTQETKEYYTKYAEEEYNKIYNSQKEIMLKRGVPPKYINCSFDNFDKNRVNIDRAIRFNQAPKDNMLIILGENGLGKTHLATAIAINHKGLYYTMYSLITELQEDFNKKRKSILDRLSECNMLVIDEFGKTSCTDAELDFFREIVDSRYRNELPLVICSNFNKQTFDGIVGKSVIDRLREKGIGCFLFGKSYRNGGNYS